MKFGTNHLNTTLIHNQPWAIVQQIIAKYSRDRSNCDTSMKLGTFTLQVLLFKKSIYISKCVDFKPHKYIKVEYKVGHYEASDTKYMSVSIMVLEI